MQQFLTSFYDLRADEQAAGPETRYYNAFEQLLERVLQNTEVRQEGLFDSGRPDFRLYHQGDSPQAERMYCLVEAKSHSTNLQQLIANDALPANRNQLRKYLEEICPNLIFTNYWEYLHLQIVNGDITVINQHQIAPSEAEFWTLGDLGEQAVLTAAQEFRTWMVQFEDIEATIDNTRNGVIMSLMNVYRGIYERFSTPYEDQQIEQIRMSILRDARVFAPASDDDAHNMLCGQVFAIGLLISRSQNPDDLLNRDTPIRDVLIRSMFNNIRLNRVAMNLATDLERADAVLSSSNLNFEESDTIEEIMLAFMRQGEIEFQSQELGLRVTPFPIVQFMIARTHQRLMSRGGVYARGLLADHERIPARRVRVLDPCVGTGRFYLGILRFIYNATLNGNPEREPIARNAILRAIGTPQEPGRIFAFDIQPACVVFTTFQLELLLGDLGIQDAQIRPQIYTTDAIEGWQGGAVGQGWLSDLEGDELIAHLQNPNRQDVNNLKQNTPLDVIIGNPPWEGSDSPDEGYQNLATIKGLIRPWRDVYHQEKNDRGQKPSNFLYDPFLCFIRIALLKDASQQNDLITCFVVPDSAAIAQTYCGMRRELHQSYDTVFDMLGGQQRRSGTWQRGKVFDVDTGSCILTYDRSEEPCIHYRTITPGTGVDKLATLRNEAENISDIQVTLAAPHMDTWYNIFYTTLEEFDSWIEISDIAVVNKPAMEENRNLSYIHLDEITLQLRCENQFFIPNFQQALEASRESIQGHQFDLWSMERSRYIPQNVHAAIVAGGGFVENNIRMVTVKPLNHVHSYYDPNITKIWHEPVTEAVRWNETNGWVIITGEIMRDSHMNAFFTPYMAGNRNIVFQNAQCLPIYYNIRRTRLRGSSREDVARFCELYGIPHQEETPTGGTRNITKSNLIAALPTFDNGALRMPNLNQEVFEQLYGQQPDTINELGEAAETVWSHVLAIMCATDYGEIPVSSFGLGSRIPFPCGDDRIEVLEYSAQLGQFLRDLSATEITEINNFENFQTSVHDWLGELIPIDNVGNHMLEFRITNWCAEVTGKGRIDPRERPRFQVHSYSDIDTENEQFESIMATWEMEEDEIIEILGGRMVTLVLNHGQNVRLPQIPEAVFNFMIGGHRVINNWLAWRDYYNLGRPIAVDDIEALRDLIHSLTCMVLLGPRLAENLETVITNNLPE